MSIVRSGVRFQFGSLCTLFVISGFTALVYQVMWMRSFSLVFGSSTRAVSVVLACFFLGMSLGNLLGGRFTKSRTEALLAYAWAELAIAFTAPLVLLWLNLYGEHYPQLYQSSLGSGASLTTVQTALALVAMAPPCVAMGVTLPLMARAVLIRFDHLGRRVAGIYALNTMGAAVAALLSGFVLPVWIGTTNSVYLAALLNATIGFAALLLWQMHRNTETADEVPDPTDIKPQAGSGSSNAVPASDARREGALAFAFAAGSGFGTLALEVFYTRLLANVLDSSVYSFAVVLATFLVSLALGSVLVAATIDRLRSPWVLASIASAGGALAIMLSPSVFEWAWGAIPMPNSSDSQWNYIGWVIGFSSVIIAPGVVLVGMVLPCIWKTSRNVGEAGRRIGRLTSVNTLAAVAGSLLAGFVILPFAGAARGIYFIASLYGVLGLLGIFVVAPRQKWLMGSALFAALAAGWILQPSRLMPLNLQPGESMLEYHEGESGSVAITSRGGGLWLRLNNHYILGTSRPAGVKVHRSQGRFGLLLHENPRDVAFIGIATGISLSAIAEFPKIERVVAMEIVPGVLAVVEVFESANLGVLRDPRVKTVLADGRNHLAGISDTFDVITADLFVPWQAGTGYLYTTEHFATVRNRLNEAGVFVQWLQLSQLTLDQLQILVATFTDVFDSSELWLNLTHPNRPLIALVGRQTEGRDDNSRSTPGRQLGNNHFVSDAFVLRQWAQTAPRNTDDFPILEFSAASSQTDLSAYEPEVLLKRIQDLARANRARHEGK